MLTYAGVCCRMLTYADVIYRDLGHGRSTLIPKDYLRVFKAKNIGERFCFLVTCFTSKQITNTDAASGLSRPRAQGHEIYLLYWYKSTRTDAPLRITGCGAT